MRNIFTLVTFAFSWAAVEVSARNLRKEHHFRPRQSNGSCGSVEIMFGTGLDGNTAGTFKPVNQKDFPHGAATDINTITSFICQRLQSPCNASQDALTKCQQAQNSVSGQSSQGGRAADNWNSDFGISSNYSGSNSQNGNQPTTTRTTTTRAQTTTTTTTPAQNNNQSTTTSATTTTPAASASQGDTQGQSLSSTSSGSPTTTAAGSDVTDIDGMVKDENCTLQAILVTVTLPADSQATGVNKPNVLVPVTGFNALDLGTCNDPTVALGQGLGGRQANEWAFMNNNIAQFPHGSTLDLPTILQFTCNNLVNRCGLSTNSPAVTACNNAEAEAMKYGNTGLGADIFNRGMGFSTYYAAVDGS